MRAFLSRFSRRPSNAERMASLRLIACDIDGTLLNDDGDVFESTIQLVHDVVAKGIRFCLVSGRSYPAARDVHEILSLDSPIAVMDGALIVGSRNEIVRQHCINASVAVHLARMRQELHFETTALAASTVYFESTPYLPEYLRHSDIVPTPVRSLEQCGPDILRYYIVGEFSILERLRRSLAEAWPNELELPLRQSRRRSSQAVMEVRPSAADKGTAVQELQRLMDVPDDRVAVIGDYENDIPMFRPEYFCVSFPNAVSALKKKANFVCQDNASQGGLDEFFRMVLSHERLNNV